MKEQAIQGGVAACAGACAALGLVKQWVLELFGVPLPVLLAAAAGAYGARTFIAAGGLWPALIGGTSWTLIGTFGAEGIRAVIESSMGWHLGAGTAPFMALVLSGLGQLLFTKELVEKLRAAVARRVDNLFTKGEG